MKKTVFSLALAIVLIGGVGTWTEGVQQQVAGGTGTWTGDSPARA